jgi:monoamine oxidase
MSFNRLFNHVNPLRGAGIRKPGGSLMCCADAPLAHELLELPDDEIARRFTSDLTRVYPQLSELISETIVQEWECGNWYQTPDSDLAALLSYSEQSTNVIHLAGDYFAAVSGSVEGATTSGLETARAVASALDQIA